jgi:hypothetical protein
MNADDCWRVLVGFLVAPLCGAVLVAFWYAAASTGWSLLLFLIAAAVGGYMVALILGLPAYLILRRLLRPRLIYVVLKAALSRRLRSL